MNLQSLRFPWKIYQIEITAFAESLTSRHVPRKSIMWMALQGMHEVHKSENNPNKSCISQLVRDLIEVQHSDVPMKMQDFKSIAGCG